MFDGEEPPKPKGILPKDLDVMGVEELTEYIEELEVEIARVRAKIAAKRDARGNAEDFFKR